MNQLHRSTAWLSAIGSAFVLLTASSCRQVTHPDSDPSSSKHGDITKDFEEDEAISLQKHQFDRSPLERGVKYLLEQQGEDGLWHSEYYGNLKQGAGVTAFVLYALAHAKPHLAEWPKPEFERAVAALQPNIEKFGYVTNTDGPDYTNYGSATLLVACQLSDSQLPERINDRLIEYLLRAQLDEDEGYAPGDPDYGGWDLSGWMTGHRLTAGTNISVTAFVVEALVPYLMTPEPKFDRSNELSISSSHTILRSSTGSTINAQVEQCLIRAARWLINCQNLADLERRDTTTNDGGFFFHPRKDHDGNKAEWLEQARSRPRSYGTATADGLRSMKLLSSALSKSDLPAEIQELVRELDERGSRAAEWLAQHSDSERVPGFEWETGDHGWRDGLIFYYWFAQAKGAVYRAAPADVDETSDNIDREIKSRLAEIQRPEGFWQNRVARMREDDPLIATCFAVITLSILEAK